MKRLAIAIAALALAAAAFAAAPDKPIKVTNNGEKAAVTFDHAKHADKACVTCHHNESEGRYKCGECHGAEEKGKVPALKNAAHGKEKGVCYACHLKPDAPAKKKCADCHAG